MSDRADLFFLDRPFTREEEPVQPSSRRGSLVGRTPLDIAITRGLEAVFAAQEQDGSWTSVEDEGVPGLALTALVSAWFGVLELEDARRYARALSDAQLPDGGFAAVPASRESSLAATALARAVLKVIGVADAAPRATRAEARLYALGGYAPLLRGLHTGSDATALFCVMAGTLGVDALPAMSTELAALPGPDRLLHGRFRVDVASLLFACASVRARTLAVSAASSLLRARTQLLAKSRLWNYLGQFQNDDGAWNGSPLETVLALVALDGVGMTRRDRPVERGLAWLDARASRSLRTLSVSSCTGSVSTTALVLTTLSACDVPAADGAVLDGLRFLEAQQITRAQPRVSQPRAGAPRAGGWSHQRGNDSMPRCHATADVLAALAVGGSPAESTPTTASGLAWLTAMQNPDGGFGVYAHGHPALRRSKLRGAARGMDLVESIASTAELSAVIERPGALGDPSTATTSARVLASLGAFGVTSCDAIAVATIAFLKDHQLASGAWKNAAGEECFETTAVALLGLARVERGSTSAVVRLRGATRARALRWLLSQQRADGGFGSTDDVSSTAIALRSLAAVFERGPRTVALQKAMERAASFLLGHPSVLGVPGIPSGATDLRARCVCLMALGAYRRARRGASVSVPSRSARRA